MKRSTKAAFLSLMIPGAGLWYCGRRGLAIANFLLAVAVPAIGLTMGFWRNIFNGCFWPLRLVRQVWHMQCRATAPIT